MGTISVCAPIGDTLKQNQPRVSRKEGMGRLIVWTCEHHYFVFVGATDPEPQKSRATNDPSGGSCVLVTGISIISSVGEAILREGTSSMHAYEIYIGVSVIS